MKTFYEGQIVTITKNRYNEAISRYEDGSGSFWDDIVIKMYGEELKVLSNMGIDGVEVEELMDYYFSSDSLELCPEKLDEDLFTI